MAWFGRPRDDERAETPSGATVAEEQAPTRRDDDGERPPFAVVRQMEHGRQPSTAASQPPPRAGGRSPFFFNPTAPTTRSARMLMALGVGVVEIHLPDHLAHRIRFGW